MFYRGQQGHPKGEGLVARGEGRCHLLGSPQLEPRLAGEREDAGKEAEVQEGHGHEEACDH